MMASCMLPAVASCQTHFFSSWVLWITEREDIHRLLPPWQDHGLLFSWWIPRVSTKRFSWNSVINDEHKTFSNFFFNCKHLDKLKPVFQESCVFIVKIFIRSNKSCRCSALKLPDLLFRCLIAGTCIWKCCPKELNSPSKSSLIGPDKSRLKYATCCGISLEYV